jgi:hypothetical protein
MTVQVTFAGTTYDVPEEEDLGWADLTDYLVALSDAQTGVFDLKAWRYTTAASNTLSASDDYALAVNCSSAATIALPVCTTGQIFVVADASGAASTNNITIAAIGGSNINGRSSYVIRSNYGAVALQFGTSEWTVLNSRESTIEQDTTNLSLIDASLAVDNTGVSASNLQSCTFTFAGPACEFIVAAANDAFKCCCSLGSNIVDCTWDPGNKFLATDAGTGVVVTKSSAIVTVKNRTGGPVTFKIKTTVGQITASTAWS